MPLDRPYKGESKQEFISRFMSSDAMQKEYPKQDQRLAVAHSKWRKKNTVGKVQDKLNKTYGK